MFVTPQNPTYRLALWVAAMAHAQDGGGDEEMKWSGKSKREKGYVVVELKPGSGRKQGGRLPLHNLPPPLPSSSFQC